MKIEVIDTGYFYADGGAMFGPIPKRAWSRIYPSDDENRCVLAMRSLLVVTDDGHVILIDNGAGNKHLHLLRYYKFFNLKDLSEELRKRGIEPEDVTDMILTHLHFDHCGYCTRQLIGDNDLYSSFPKARHWVSRAQWENFLHPNPLEASSYFMENMEIIAKRELLNLIDTETEIAPSVRLSLYDGHTPGQIVPYINTTGQTYVFAGDVIPLAAHLSRNWISAYDTRPILSYQEKTRLLDEVAEQEHAIIFCHDAYTTCCTVKRNGDHFRIKEKIALSPCSRNIS